MTSFRKIAVTVGTTVLFASIAFAQLKPGMGGGGMGGHGGPGWKHKDWSQQFWGDNNPWNEKQTDRLKRMAKDIAEEIDENSDYLNKNEQFEIARRLMDIRQYIDSVTPDLPPPIDPGGGQGGNFEIVGMLGNAPVSNSPMQQNQWLQFALNGPSSLDALQIEVQQTSPSKGMKPAFIRIYEVRVAMTKMGGPQVVGSVMQTFEIGMKNPNLMIPIQLIGQGPGPKKADRVWVRAEAMNATFNITIKALNKQGGGFGFPGGGFPGGGGNPHHMGKPNGNNN